MSSVARYEAICRGLNAPVDPMTWSDLYCRQNKISCSSKSALDPSMLAYIKFLSDEEVFPEIVLLGNEFLSRRFRAGNWICGALSLNSQKLALVRVLDFQGLGIDGLGMALLVKVASSLKQIEVLSLKRNFLGLSNGAFHLVSFLEKCPASLKLLDISFNKLSFACLKVIRSIIEVKHESVKLHIMEELDSEIQSLESTAIAYDEVYDSNKHFNLFIEGNFPKVELWNSATHGLGIILALVGLVEMLYVTYAMSKIVILSVIVYMGSAFLLFTASTIYHSFFMLSYPKRVFHVADHCSIFVLIAGSYTPVCIYMFEKTKSKSYIHVLEAEWAFCLGGILLHALSQHNRKWLKSGVYMLIETSLYLAMGWMAVTVWDSISTSLPSQALYFLIVGGLWYTGGLTFFIWDSVKVYPPFHAIWHVFVLMGSISHFIAIRSLLIA
jgi:hemolysin III